MTNTNSTRVKKCTNSVFCDFQFIHDSSPLPAHYPTPSPLTQRHPPFRASQTPSPLPTWILGSRKCFLFLFPGWKSGGSDGLSVSRHNNAPVCTRKKKKSDEKQLLGNFCQRVQVATRSVWRTRCLSRVVGRCLQEMLQQTETRGWGGRWCSVDEESAGWRWGGWGDVVEGEGWGWGAEGEGSSIRVSKRRKCTVCEEEKQDVRVKGDNKKQSLRISRWFEYPNMLNKHRKWNVCLIFLTNSIHGEKNCNLTLTLHRRNVILLLFA